MELEKFLEDFENRLDTAVEEDLLGQWQQFLSHRFAGDVFAPKRTRPAPAKVEWPQIRVNATFDDPAQMLLRELSQNSQILANGTGNLLNIRSNFGTSILPSIFGVDNFFMADELDTLPTSLPIAGGAGAIRQIVDAGMPDVSRGWVPKVFEFARYFQAALQPYPKTARFVQIYHPDLQGPLDAAEIVWGSSIFLEFYDNADLVDDFLRLITDCYIRLMDRWYADFPGLPGKIRSHWGWGHNGNIVLRDDSAMNLAPEMYARFALPFDRELLARYGGVVHFCGRGDHYIDLLSDAAGLTGIQMSQPQYNDLDKMFEHTLDRKLFLFAFDPATAERCRQNGRDFRGHLHVWE